MLRSQWLKHGAGVGGGRLLAGQVALGLGGPGEGRLGAGPVSSTPLLPILPSPCQDFRVGLQSPSSESREAKGPNVLRQSVSGGDPEQGAEEGRGGAMALRLRVRPPSQGSRLEREEDEDEDEDEVPEWQQGRV